MRLRYLLALSLLFFGFTSVEAKPRFPFPATPDETGQNDRDLDDEARFVQENLTAFMAIVSASTNSLSAGSTSYIQNKAADGTLQANSVGNISSLTVTGQSRVFNPSSDATLIVQVGGGGFSPLLRFKNVSGITTSPEIGMENDAGGGSGRYGAPASSFVLATFSTHPIVALTNSIIRWKADESGNILQPTQPSFLVTDGNGATDVTGDGTGYTNLWPTEVYDQGSNFASNTFTAPVTGRYLLTSTVHLKNLLITHTEYFMQIVTSNRTYTDDHTGALARADDAVDLAIVADMDTGDTATILIGASGGTKTVDTVNDARFNFFSGSLIN